LCLPRNFFAISWDIGIWLRAKISSMALELTPTNVWLSPQNFLTKFLKTWQATSEGAYQSFQNVKKIKFSRIHLIRSSRSYFMDYILVEHRKQSHSRRFSYKRVHKCFFHDSVRPQLIFW
jgi:hypothetical protein